MPSLSELLNAKLSSDGMTLAQAADKAGVSLPSMRTALNGSSLPNARSIGKYASFLGIGEGDAIAMVESQKGGGSKRGRKPGKKSAGKAKVPGKKRGRPPGKAKAKASAPVAAKMSGKGKVGRPAGKKRGRPPGKAKAAGKVGRPAGKKRGRPPGPAKAKGKVGRPAGKKRGRPPGPAKAKSKGKAGRPPGIAGSRGGAVSNALSQVLHIVKQAESVLSDRLALAVTKLGKTQRHVVESLVKSLGG